jgi:hypothetical protein
MIIKNIFIHNIAYLFICYIIDDNKKYFQTQHYTFIHCYIIDDNKKYLHTEQHCYIIDDNKNIFIHNMTYLFIDI